MTTGGDWLSSLMWLVQKITIYVEGFQATLISCRKFKRIENILWTKIKKSVHKVIIKPSRDYFFYAPVRIDCAYFVKILVFDPDFTYDIGKETRW